MTAHTFNVVYEDASDGWVYAHVPELPEVHTQGESLDQAREMVRDAIELVLEERRARGETIPPTGWALVESVEMLREEARARAAPRCSRLLGSLPLTTLSSLAHAM